MIAQEKIDYSLLDDVQAINILAVEDELVSMNFLQAQINNLGHEFISATNGQEALKSLDNNHANIDVIIMDREMPIMDGLTAVKKIKQSRHFKNIPIIMVTGADSTQEMQEGMDAGVFYYLTKPVDTEMLKSVLSAAIRESKQTRTLAKELGRHKTSFHLIDTAKFKYKTLSDAESLSAFIANCFPEPERVLSGLGELLINAVEHGNLNIGYDKKSDLVTTKTWRSEIDRMQQLPENTQKHVTVTIAHKDDGTYVIIEDEGSGFEWKKFLTIDPSRSGDNHGRGIAQARATSFDKLTYNEKGNQAVAYVGLGKQLQW